MKIMILGANGFTGRRILRRLTQRKEHTLLACSLHPDILPEEGYRFETLDMLDYIATDTLLNDFHPEVIVNASALSVVDYCEQHPEEAFAMNVSAVKHLAEYCQAHECRLIHLSTDFVFDGTQTEPYTETDTPNPVNYYGKTKRWGEEAIEQTCKDYAIVRVEVVYGKPLDGQHGNIVHLVKNRLENGQGIRVVADQFRSPTYVEDIARAIELLLSNQHQGIYHICGGETLSVADIAHRVAKYFRLDASLIESVTTKEMNEATSRPLYSPMSTQKAFRELGYEPSLLEEGLKEWE
ncbi:MAG: dTDP-4-dehydrorhamnose reductase [Bacteroidaceae bacterium]|nr:dTDP-4-dehydrorhamnose reductase [Bacteroidaceae bacterium]